MAFYGLLRGFWLDFRDLEAREPLERRGRQRPGKARQSADPGRSPLK
jgi:hypothetical protein